MGFFIQLTDAIARLLLVAALPFASLTAQAAEDGVRAAPGMGDAVTMEGVTLTLPDGRVFVVVGDPDDNNAGPFGFTPGYRVTLRRVHDG
jgi:hypothetical protein